MCNPGNENCYRIHLYIQERRKPNGEYSVFSSDGYRLLPSASDIGFFARYADASASGSCAL